jgi:hydrogenase maturation protein HypF
LVEDFGLRLLIVSVQRHRILVRGTVQGVGFRPFVWTLAQQLDCVGWVCNDADGVTIELQGTLLNLETFYARLTAEIPTLASISEIRRELIAVREDLEGFSILESQSSDCPKADVSPDMAICGDCLRELHNPTNRRYAYPFINCTHCGPRYTIQTGVPYDRSRTTMCGFRLCEECSQEYASPADRRFHAQPNACPKCGPSIWYATRDSSGQWGDEGIKEQRTPWIEPIDYMSNSSEVLGIVESIRNDIARGLTVAIKGIGGFHLACDARNACAVRMLRERKQRPFKPFAVMVLDLDTASQIVELGDTDAQRLLRAQRPIVLLRKRAGTLPEEVAPNNPYLGVLLPYAPLHHLLLRADDVWIMTSGNLSDEPIACENEDAWRRLRPLADGMLFHNRPIHAVCDDSVVRSTECGQLPIRRARGYVPLPVPLKSPGPTILAVGGEIKTALCLGIDSRAIMGPHLGDMGNRETFHALERSRGHLTALYRALPEYIAADSHPGYMSAEWAQRHANSLGLPLIHVQHHHAHAASLLAEHGVNDEESILACVLDGTGFGTDGAIWGGEILIASARSFQRAAHWEYLPLPGGDRCIATPAKTALAFLYGSGLDWKDAFPCFQHFSESERKRLVWQLERRFETVSTSSMGRIFDAVSSLIGVRHAIDYEGQAALELEAIAHAWTMRHGQVSPYDFEWKSNATHVFLTRSVLQQICQDVENREPSGLIAARFHQTIAASLTAICRRLKDDQRSQKVGYSLVRVGLTGGVFQNAFLLDLSQRSLEEAGFVVLRHSVVPPNDGGLGLGQVVVARAKLREQQENRESG